ncbi:SPRY domain-containing protein 7 [Sitodiplosis mosellana]|uniref:SPRY domain-containing protein 7 n=1 Tax=Sitodiplosis mosellana TaxID=263140 RepID=UPI0024447FD3|nr:SPRY domain-containing protein 7 [Sitodiplosis mosellana]
MLCCLKFLYGGRSSSANVAMKMNQNNIQLDTANMGHEVVILKNGCRICGSGGALATAPLVQSKSYFEVKLQQSGHWSIGLATHKTDLNKSKGGTDTESWCLNSDHIVLHNNTEIHKLSLQPADISSSLENINDVLPGTNHETGIPAEGDTIGVAYDHVEMNFYLNGKKLDIPTLSIKGTVYPALFVDDGAILDIILDDFNFGPPPGFDKIMLEQSLL